MASRDQPRIGAGGATASGTPRRAHRRAQDRQRLAVRARHGHVAALDDRRLLAGDVRDRRPEAVRVVEAHVGEHRHPPVPGVGGVEPPAEAHLDQGDVEVHLGEVAEHDRGQELELRGRAEAPGDAIRGRQRLVHEPREVRRRDRPPVHDDPLPVGHEVRLGGLAHPVPGGPQRGARQGDDAPLAVRARDQRPAHRQLRVAHRTQQRADAAQAQADPEAAAGLDRLERLRVGPRVLRVGPRLERGGGGNRGTGSLTRGSARPRRRRTG